MTIEFRSVCRNEGVEIALFDKRLFRDKALNQSIWTDPPELIGPITRRLLTLVDEGIATRVESKLLIKNEAAAEFHGSLASKLGLPPLAPIMVDVAFQGRIGEP